MNKKQDLKLVFEFIADFLKEEKDTSPAKATVSVSDTSKGLPKSVTELNDVKRAVSIMNRLNDIDKAKGDAMRRIKTDEDLKLTLQTQLNELRSKHAELVSEDTIAEEKELEDTIAEEKELEPKTEWFPNITLEAYTGSTLEQVQTTHDSTIQKHEEIKAEVKDKLGVDLDVVIANKIFNSNTSFSG
jgi:hypothetical protein